MRWCQEPSFFELIKHYAQVPAVELADQLLQRAAQEQKREAARRAASDDEDDDGGEWSPELTSGGTK
jgi:hypothetical protein